MKGLIQAAVNGRLMGDFEVPVFNRPASPLVPKDIGCAEVERRPYYYYGKCIDCPLPKCLEDTALPGSPYPMERQGISARHKLWVDMLKYQSVINTAAHFGVSRAAVYAMIRRGKQRGVKL